VEQEQETERGGGEGEAARADPLTVYVFQRPSPYKAQGNMKDGIHLMYPYLCVHTDIQLLIRSEVVSNIDRFLEHTPRLAVKNKPDDIVDLAVIKRNNWLMFGCSKPGIPPYNLYRIWRSVTGGYNPAEIPPNAVPVTLLNESLPDTSKLESFRQLVNLLSIHRVPAEHTYAAREPYRSRLATGSGIKSPGEKADPVAGIGLNVHEVQELKKLNNPYIKSQTRKMFTEDEERILIEEATVLVDLLAVWRADDYHSWVQVGLCLHNIMPGPRLKDVWAKFSRKSAKYQMGDEERWSNFREIITGLNMGSLHRWARLDNPEKYKTIRRNLLRPMMIQSVTGTTQDVARVVHRMFKHQYVCMHPKGNTWAEFKNHTWHVLEDGISLKQKIGNEVCAEYGFLCSYYWGNFAEAADKGLDSADAFKEQASSLSELTYKLRDITFKEKVMKECVLLFYDPEFELKLNSNPYLIGLNNGVYDLHEGIFRDGQPEDCISITTGQDYPEKFIESDIDLGDPNRDESAGMPEVQEIFQFMRQVFPIRAVRHYMWRCLASYLKGYNTDEKFHIWTGSGGNGKSKLLELFEMAFGSYCFKVPITVLTQGRSKTGQATPEMAMGRYCRFASMQEPDEGAKINTGLMKELSGNDKIYYRELFKSGAVMKPQFSMILMCNVKPKLSSDDDGTWRRLEVIEFISKFVDGEPKGPNEFRRDRELVKRFETWAPYFFAVLTLCYKYQYAVYGLNPSTEITMARDEYRKESDAYTQFVDEHLVRAPDQDRGLMLTDTYLAFADWYRAEINETAPNRQNFKRAMDKKLGLYSKTKGWRGWQFRPSEE
jgi:P4 family phage/plasmid primase-like protien